MTEPTAANSTTFKHWRLQQESDGIASLFIDRQGASANTLSAELIRELDQALDAIEAASPRGLIIRSGKASGFIAGADIKGFTTLDNEDQAVELIQQAHDAFNRLAKLSIPTVAVIDGFCLGGGLELALACRYRVACDNDRTRLGLPEVLLGIHPGFGGTARLVGLIGAPAAMDLMLTGRSLRAKPAKRVGLVDYAVPERSLDAAAARLLQDRPPAFTPKWYLRGASHALVRPILARVMKKKVAKKASPKHYPAPYALIDLWRRHGDTPAIMLKEEIRSIAKLITGYTAKNLIRVFFLQEKLKGLGKGKAGTKAEQVHVIGGGIMGGDIAAWCALRGLRVSVQDPSAEALGRVVKRAHELFKKRLRDPRLVQAALDRLMPDPHGNGVGRADIVIEAIFEDAEAKKKLFRSVEPKLKTDALLATNTSSIPLETLSQALARPERLVGLHFFNPVAKMQLVEVVRGSGSDKAQIDRAAAFAQQIGRLPVIVKSSPGFLVNRILMPYLLEAVTLVDEGVSKRAIDKAATDFGMPMGPVTLADTVGLDICLHVARNLTETLGGSVPQSLIDKVETGDLGKKTGRGFYTWQNDKPQGHSENTDRTGPETCERMVLRFLNKAVACLREGVIDKADLLDAGVIFGTGFAPFRGGPMHYIQHEGAEKLRDNLQQLADTHGERFKPDPGWSDLN